jgi:capsular exopolysaccharide synthesis family protein
MSQFWQALEQAKRDRALQAPQSLPVPAPPEPKGESPVRLVVDAPAEPLHRLDDHLVSLLAPASFAAEQYRALRFVIEQTHRESAVSVVGVSSPSVGDGKTTTAINLAGALSQAADARVLLLDLDVRRPAIGQRLGLDPSQPGVVDAIVDPRLELADIAKTVRPFNFVVVLGGQSAKGTYELFKAARLRTLLEEARESYDYVIIDAPPLLPMPDCQLIGGFVDKFIVVLACDKTPRRALAEALNVLAPEKVLGLVFTRNDQLLSDYRREDYGEKLRGARWRRAVKRLQPFDGAKTRSSDSR